MYEFSSVVLRVSWSVGIGTRRYTIFTEQEMASSCFHQANRGTCSKKPPLSPGRACATVGRYLKQKVMYVDEN